jgi:hypothetical protein
LYKNCWSKSHFHTHVNNLTRRSTWGAETQTYSVYERLFILRCLLRCIALGKVLPHRNRSDNGGDTILLKAGLYPECCGRPWYFTREMDYSRELNNVLKIVKHYAGG